MSTFYDVDLRRAKLREFAFGTPWYLMPLVGLFKLLNVSFPGTTDDPPVESLAPFEVERTALPLEVRAQFTPLVEQLTALGFHSPIYHAIDYPLHATRTYWATFLHPSGRAWGRIHCRIWSGGGTEKVFLFPMFFSALDEGFLVTSGGKPDMLMPEGVRMVNQVGASVAELWQRHNQELEALLPCQPRPVADAEQLRTAMEQYHARVRDYNLERGVFKPLPEPTEPPATPVKADDTAPPIDPEDAPVLAEIERLQSGRSSPWAALLILMVSLLLFVAAARVGKLWDMLWVLIPVLAFHEAGHYLAMRYFGYRNLHMFFIPFLGAAVSGRHYNVAGWKKAVVALMGPVPGIVVGGIIGIVGLFLRQEQVVFAALMMIILNGFNLLPLLPLDGGWVVHAVLFVRHPLLDAVFRLLAIVGLFGIALLFRDTILLILPVLMLMGLPMAWRIARIAHRLRQQGVVALSPDAQSIPRETAVTILTELRAALPRPLPTKVLAQHVANVFETLNARPPGVAASLVLLAVHAGSFLAAIVLTVMLVLGPHIFAELQAFLGGKPFLEGEPADWEPTNVYVPGSTEVRRGADAALLPAEKRVTLIATFADPAAAKRAFDALSAELPRRATLRWFGQSLLLTLPAEQRDEHALWMDRLRQQAGQIAVERQDFWVPIKLSCTAPSPEEAERLEAEVREYLHVPYFELQGLLLPPWSDAWQALPPEERQRYRKARRTLIRLQDLSSQVAQHPDIQAMNQRLLSTLGGNDKDAIRKLRQDIEQATRAEEQRLLENLRAEGEETVDLTIVALWEQHWKVSRETFKEKEGVGPAPPAPEGQPRQPADPQVLMARFQAWEQTRKAVVRQMAERMGQLPLRDGWPELGSNLEAAMGGSIQREGAALSICCVCCHPSEGLPALAEWLCRRGCTEVKYGFQPSRQEDEPSRQEDEPSRQEDEEGPDD
ncbi:MAG TPA: hypothetical protein VNK04_22250 [Gemmataceae bacterium]|nr:hypothetical protein [Gemmataceae bacterium]